MNDEGIIAEGKALMRDADFLISVKKPVEIGINSVRLNGETFSLNENHFLITLEHSRHGKNGFNFVATFINNEFVELDLTNSYRKKATQEILLAG